jgi:thiol:disulfide interchange protein DsbD
MKLFLVKFFLLFSFISHSSTLSELLKSPNKPLSVEQAFQVSSHIFENEIIVQFTIAKDHYLYREKIQFTIDGQAVKNIIMPSGETIEDEYLGKTQVYPYSFNLTLSSTDIKNKSLIVYYQGCSKSGTCYPPQKKIIEHISQIND